MEARGEEEEETRAALGVFSVGGDDASEDKDKDA